MDFWEALTLFARFVWPALLAWNIYLYRQIQFNNRELFDFKIGVAREYMNKNDMKEMFTDFEERIDKRLDQLFALFCNNK